MHSNQWTHVVRYRTQYDTQPVTMRFTNLTDAQNFCYERIREDKQMGRKWEKPQVLTHADYLKQQLQPA